VLSPSSPTGRSPPLSTGPVIKKGENGNKETFAMYFQEAKRWLKAIIILYNTRQDVLKT
jgi:hypothetical protein